MSVQEFPAVEPRTARRRVSRAKRNGVSVAVVGCGYWGSKHVRVLSALEDVSEVILVEQDERTRREVSASYPDAYTAATLQEILPKVHAVVVATSPREHVSTALHALRAGKHVLVEKPLTTNSGDAQTLIAEAVQRKLVLMVAIPSSLVRQCANCAT